MPVASDLRQKPGAEKPHAGICAGGGRQLPLLPRPAALDAPQFLRDQEVLRSGEKWNPALISLIEKADIFQLCWSQAARQSRYVRQEWRHALQQDRNNFIRPVYWQIPLPKPLKELKNIHFSYLPPDT
jgi:hypothetical protein